MRHALLTINPRDVPIRVALRNTLGVAGPLAVGVLGGHPGAGIAVAIGALNAMFADQPGPYRLRLQRMVAIALLAALSAWVGASIGQWTALLIVVALAWGVIFGLWVALGPEPGRAGLTSMILLLVTADHPLPPADALAFAGLVLAGGLLQASLAIVAWPLQRFRPERLALAQVFRQLADAARHPTASHLPPPTTQSLQDVQQLLQGPHRARGAVAQTFRVLATLAERIRVELLALADLRQQLDGDDHRAAADDVLETTAVVMLRIATALERGDTVVNAAIALDDTSRAIERLRGLRDGGGTESDLLRIVIARADGLAAGLRSALRNTRYAGSRGERRQADDEALLPMTLQPTNPLATLRAHLTLSSVAMRHALRCGVCLAIAVAIARHADLDHGFWLPMTTAIVLKPDFVGTFSFGMLRVAGTLFGLLGATLLLDVAGTHAVLLLGCFALLCFAFRLLTTVHYAIGVAALTGLIVILLHFEGDASGSTVVARIVGTAGGAALALLAYALWPTRESERLMPALAAMIDGYRVYFADVVAGDALQRHTTRQQARSRRGNARASLDRLHGEPLADRRLLDLGEAIYANANRLARASMALEAVLLDANELPQAKQVHALAARIDAALLALAQGIRNGSEVDVDGLRDDERELHARLLGDAEADHDVAIAVAHACDRMTDSIDTLAHLLDGPSISASAPKSAIPATSPR